MSIDPTVRRSGRITDLTGSDTQSTEKKILEDSSVATQQRAEPPKFQNQNSEAANSRKAESGMKANQLQSQLLNQTNKNISTGTNRVTNHPLPGANTAALQKAFKMYGITNDQLQRYVATGEEPEGFKKAINVANQKGDWSALNVVRESYKMRAAYIRANSSPNDKQARAAADQLDAASEYLTGNRKEIKMNNAVGRLKASNGVDQKIIQANKDIEDVGSEFENQIDTQTAPLRKKQ